MALRRRAPVEKADYSAVLTPDHIRQIRAAAEHSDDPRRLRESVALMAASHEALRAHQQADNPTTIP